MHTHTRTLFYTYTFLCTFFGCQYEINYALPNIYHKSAEPLSFTEHGNKCPSNAVAVSFVDTPWGFGVKMHCQIGSYSDYDANRSCKNL